MLTEEQKKEIREKKVESVEIGICPHCGAEDLTEDFELDLRVEYVSTTRTSEEFLCKGPCWDAVMSPACECGDCHECRARQYKSLEDVSGEF